MKSAKIILGSAAFLVTIGSTLAFKVAKRFTGQNARVQLSNQCVTCADLWNSGLLGRNTRCHTLFYNALVTGAGPFHYIFFTARINPYACTHPTSRTTKFNP